MLMKIYSRFQKLFCRMLPFDNKELLKEFVNNELRKGLRVKFVYDYDPVYNVSLHMSNKRRELMQSVQNKKEVKKNLNKNTWNKIPIANNTLAKSWNLQKSRIPKSPQNIKRRLTGNGKIYNLTKFNARDYSHVRLKPVHSDICIARNNQPLVKIMRKVNTNSDSQFLLGKMKEAGRNKVHFRPQNEKYKKSKVTTGKTHHQCNLQVKDGNFFDGNNCKSLLEQVLKFTSNPEKKDHLIGPIPIRAEGIDNLTSRIEELVNQSGDGVVHKKLKLCKQNETAGASFEFDVAIRKVAIEEVSVPTKRNNLSLLWPMFCLASPQDSECLETRERKPIFPAVKIPWRSNMPFFERFRLNPQSCNVKVLNCDMISALVGRKVVKKDVQSKMQHSSSTYTDDIKVTVKKDEKELSNKSPVSVKDRYLNRVNKLSRDRFRRYIDTSCRMNSSLTNSESVVISHRRPLMRRPITRISPVLYRKLFLSPTDKKIKGTSALKDKVPSSIESREDMFETPEEIHTEEDKRHTRSKSNKQEKRGTVQVLRSSFRNAFEIMLQSSFKRAFEISIRFIDPNELDTCVQKNFSATNYCVQKGSFVLKEMTICRYFHSISHWEKMNRIEKVCLTIQSVSSCDIPIHMDDMYLGDVLKCFEKQIKEVSFQSEEELKSVFLSSHPVKSTKPSRIPKPGKPPVISQKRIASTHPPKVKSITTGVSKWIRPYPKSMGSRGGGDRVNVNLNIGNCAIKSVVKETDTAGAVQDPIASKPNTAKKDRVRVPWMKMASKKTQVEDSTKSEKPSKLAGTSKPEGTSKVEETPKPERTYKTEGISRIGATTKPEGTSKPKGTSKPSEDTSKPSEVTSKPESSKFEDSSKEIGNRRMQIFRKLGPSKKELLGL